MTSRLIRALRPKRGGRLPLVLLAVVCAGGVTAAVADASTAPPGLDLAQIGHWIFQPDKDTVFRVNGASGTVDAKVRVEGFEPQGTESVEVVQGPTSGYVISGSRGAEFGKSTLRVERKLDLPTEPTGEAPVAVEAKGGPYLVYRELGNVVRLGGDDPATISAGGSLGEPVATPDGTLWLQRRDSNVLCQLPSDADKLSCSTAAPQGHSGGLTVVGKRAVFVDTEDDTLSTVTGAGLGDKVDIGENLPANAKIAPVDVDGQVAVLDPSADRLHLVDAAHLDQDRADRPVTVQLPDGDYAAPAAGRSSVVLLDLRGKKLRTFDRTGRPQGETDVPDEEGREPRLKRGQDQRVYVDGGKGRNVLVVGDGGRPDRVEVTGSTSREPSQRPEPPPVEPTQPASPPATQGTQQGAPRPQSDNQPPRTTSTQQSTQRPRPETTTTRPSATRPRPATPTTRPATSRPATPRPPAPKPPAAKPPPSPPGMPPGVKATVSGTTIKVSWGAAKANGSTVNGYKVTWSASGGKSGTNTRPGGSRSFSINGLTRAKVYTVRVAARNAVGWSTAASVKIKVPPAASSRSVRISRGGSAEHGNCVPPRCAYIRVVVRGFAPRTKVDIDIFSSEWGEFNPGATLTTDSKGNLTVSDRFPYNGTGGQVWVTANGVESNRLSSW